MITKGRFEKSVVKCDVANEVNKAIDMISKGWFLVDNNTALQHELGGYLKLSKKVSNHFNK